MTTPSMLDIKNVIFEGNKAITEKIDRVAIMVAVLSQDMGTRADGVEEILGAHTSQQAEEERGLKLQGTKLTDLEGRSHINNLHILGLPEGMETVPVEQFLVKWLPKCMRIGTEVEMTVNRAHRTPGGRPKSRAPSTMMIAGMLPYKDKISILVAACQQGEIELHWSRISFYPDYSVEMQKRTRTLVEVKWKQWDNGWAYALLTPAQLRVDHQGKNIFSIKRKKPCNF
ncbi:hypothetical protein NDU88_002742 [Pleurodeles waltl]|uniref:Uncharacterized protein n=1 Tax=Pleurodeles waltl TaxID=8319 RepID=A0AAV7TLK1_PLEWA|nr:hypothetical protein NDU88_002742 [Pleurodeles waltl]